MSNGDPPPQSSAPYIIICSGRTAVAAAKSTVDKIAAASYCAAQLCSFLESAHGVESGAFAAVSTIQHELMDGMATMSKDEAEAKVEQLFTELDRLEHEYGDEHEY